jgi:hypothetical protein
LEFFKRPNNLLPEGNLPNWQRYVQIENERVKNDITRKLNLKRTTSCSYLQQNRFQSKISQKRQRRSVHIDKGNPKDITIIIYIPFGGYIYIYQMLEHPIS